MTATTTPAISTPTTSADSGVPDSAPMLPLRACVLAVAASALAIALMQYAIITHSDIEGLLRLKAQQSALGAAEIDELVARQAQQLRYAPLMSLLFWPLCLVVGAGVYAAVLRALGGSRFVFAPTLRAFTVGIAAAYAVYALVGAAIAVATGAPTFPNGPDVFFAQASVPWKTALQTFDLANLGAVAVAGFLIFRAVDARRTAFVAIVLGVLGVYAGAKAALVSLSVPADKPVVCELCKLSAEPGERSEARP
ncbi:hypothetical protein [Dokdonella sp.]|uniref:hypothetical protein n=1 Tax=Dokdonella sp. TaxID=2291710 RepID=UPI001B1EE5A4|nr:hypothetical protein [Dokdonella sp.]MBO9664753.1 hypothetical protein [Dokdonella sp.]